MANSVTWPLQTPMIVNFPAPIDDQDPSAEVVFNTDGVMTCRALYPRASTKLLTDHFGSVSQLLIADDPTDLFLDDNATLGVFVKVELHDGTYDLLEVLGIDADAKVLNLVGTTTSDADKGGAVTRYVGPEITGAKYNYANAALDTRDWGWRAEFPRTHDMLQKTEQVQIEAELISVASGARIYRKWDLVVADSFREPKQGTWTLGQGLLLDIVAPLDRDDPGTPVIVPTGATAQARVYRAGVEVTTDALMASGFAGAMTLKTDPVAAGFAVGHEFAIQLDDGTRQVIPITAIDADAKTITFVEVLDDSVKRGALVRRQIGAIDEHAGTNYGTFDASKDTGWGFTIELPWNFVAASTTDGQMRVGQRYLVEAELDDVSGAHWEQSWIVQVVEPYQAP